MADQMKVVLAKDQRLDDRGNSLSPGTAVATITFSDDIPAQFRSLAYLGSALSSCRVVDERALPPQADVPEATRQVTAPMMSDLVSD